MRYNHIIIELKGVSPKTLADTLKKFRDSGIINRESFNEIPPRVEYSLTDDGKQLREAAIPIIRWAVARSTHKDCIVLRTAMKG